MIKAKLLKFAQATAIMLLFLPLVFTQHQPRAGEKYKIIWRDWARHYPNCEKLYRAMKDINANGWYLDWNTNKTTGVEAFLAANAKRGKDKLDVSTFCHALPPVTSYGKGHKAFTAYVANLAKKHPSLISYGGHDLVPERHAFFKPESIIAFMNIKDSINPNLKYLPTLYHDVRGNPKYFMDGDPYKPALRDGAVMFYWASYQSPYNVKLSRFGEYLSIARQNMKPPMVNITGIYPVAHGMAAGHGNIDALFHHPDTLRKMLKMCMDSTDGLYIYGFPVWLHDTTALFRESLFKKQANDDSNFDFKLCNTARAMWCWYQGVSARVSLPAKLSSATISFKMKDNGGITTDRALKRARFIQLVINNKTVWEQDIFADDTQTRTITENVLDSLKGTSAKIILRYVAKKPHGKKAAVYVGDIKVTLNGKVYTPTFKFESGLVHKSKWMEMYNIVKEALGGPVGMQNGPRKTPSTLQLREASPLHARPLHQSTVFDLLLPATGNVSLRVYDMAGRLLTNLVDGEMPAGGHSVKWNRRGMAACPYFVSLKTNETSVVKRVSGF